VRFEIVEPAGKSALHEVLNFEIQGGVDGEAAHDVGIVPEPRDAAQHLVDEERRLEGLVEALLQAKRLVPRVLELLRGKPSVLGHQVEHLIPPDPRAVGMAKRGVEIWRVDQTGNRRRFGDGQVTRLLAEERARPLTHAEDTDRFGLPEINVVEVGLENLLLGHARLEDQREHRLVGLASDSALGRKEEVLGQLLGDRAASLADTATTEVDPEGAQESERIDSGMRGEARILSREHGRDNVLRKVAERQHAPLSEYASYIGAEQLRLDRSLSDFAAIRIANRLDYASRKIESHDLLRMCALRVREATQRDVDSITASAKRPRLAGGAGDLLVAEAAQA
jgi:hypothetical protein